jgi:hypothetical protein
MISLFNRVKRYPLKGDEVRITVREQADITDQTPAERVMDRGGSLNTVLPKDEFQPIEQSKKTGLVTELQNLIKIIDEQIS